MTQTSNRFFDEIARLMNDAAGVAQGVRREFETLMRTQGEKILREMDVVRREDFEAVQDMARLAREENDALKARVAAIEAAAKADPWRYARHSGGAAPAQRRRGAGAVSCQCRLSCSISRPPVAALGVGFRPRAQPRGFFIRRCE